MILYHLLLLRRKDLDHVVFHVVFSGRIVLSLWSLLFDNDDHSPSCCVELDFYQPVVCLITIRSVITGTLTNMSRRYTNARDDVCNVHSFTYCIRLWISRCY